MPRCYFEEGVMSMPSDKKCKYEILDDLVVTDDVLAGWQKLLDLIATIFNVPASLIMRVHADAIEVFVSSTTQGNPYVPGATESLDSGLYCETVMDTNKILHVANALKDPVWSNNPDVPLHMISYLGMPVHWPTGELFGTICILDTKERHYEEKMVQLFEEFQSLVNANLEIVYSKMSLQRSNEKLEQLNAEKNRMIGIAAHDLRNPLATIKNAATFLGSGSQQIKTETRERLNAIIYDSSDYMIALLNTLLDVSTIEAGMLSLSLETIDLCEIVEQTVQFNAIIAQNKKIPIVLETGNDPVMINADPNKMHQVFNNLLSNATKYSFPNTKITVRLQQEENAAIVSVIDEGQGIPQEEQSKLFKPYSTTTTTPTAREGSAGLGLFIVAKIIEGHHGTITCESTKGEGATFRVSLPLA